ncbi:MAG: hypothetical protein ACRC6U_09155 [Fusobacteriaceae bacterium]
MLSPDAAKELIQENILMTFINKDEILGSIVILADEIRENVTGQLKLMK